MAAVRVVVKFADGSERTVIRRPIHNIRAEGIVAGHGGGGTTLMWATFWAADTGGRGSWEAFEKWADTVEDFDLVEAEEDADPPGNGGTTSPD